MKIRELEFVCPVCDTWHNTWDRIPYTTHEAMVLDHLNFLMNEYNYRKETE